MSAHMLSDMLTVIQSTVCQSSIGQCVGYDKLTSDG